jgi:hypothetical protein
MKIDQIKNIVYTQKIHERQSSIHNTESVFISHISQKIQSVIMCNTVFYTVRKNSDFY